MERQLSAFFAVKMICEGYAKNVLLVAFTNSAANEFARELSMVLGPEGSKFLCVRSGYAPGFDSDFLYLLAITSNS